ncbi:hypothetical protein AB1Y20_016680 [Prymnesium parvum]|uniref:Guanine nucleotide-binding protein subunit beta-like protein n=1 Tax=Prymnesium parvum TaxID=97485 RepID=A0AB34IAR2_PRYPA
MASVDVVCGSYEGGVIGYSLRLADLAEPHAEGLPVAPVFAEAEHSGCVRCVACGEGLMATGGTDHAIAVYNLRRRRSHGKLLQETGGAAIHCLAFHGQTHLVAGGADGDVSIWRTSDWECLLRVKGHKAAVLDVAIHPSGRVALSVGADAKLMLWNLTTGKCNYTLALQQVCSLVRWSETGEEYLLASRGAVQVCDLRSGEELHTLPHDDGPPLGVQYASASLVATGSEGGTLRVWDLRRRLCAVEVRQAHERRVKALAVVSGPGEGVSTLVSASTDGSVKLWRLTHGAADADEPAVTFLLTIATRCRLTCLTAVLYTPEGVDAALASGAKPGKQKMKRLGEAAATTDGAPSEPAVRKAKKKKKLHKASGGSVS